MIFDINKEATFLGHKDSIYHLSNGFTTNDFLSASGDGYIVQWFSPEQGKPIVKVDHSIYTFEKTYDNKIWVGENNNGLHLINIEEKKIETFLKLGKVSVFSIKCFENKLFVANSIGFLHIIDLKTNSFIKHIQISSKSIRTIAILPENREIAMGCSDHQIYIYDLDTLNLKHTLRHHTNSVFSLFYIDKHLYTTGRDAHINVWDVSQNYKLLQSVPAHNYAINHILPLDGTNYMASCSMDKSIKIWDLKSLKLLKVIDKGKHASHGTSINRLLWNHDTKRLFAGSDDRSISKWKLF